MIDKKFGKLSVIKEVSKNKNGQYHIVDFDKMIGWYSVSEYYR